jgi:hypothetical protein
MLGDFPRNGKVLCKEHYAKGFLQKVLTRRLFSEGRGDKIISWIMICFFVRVFEGCVQGFFESFRTKSMGQFVGNEWRMKARV